jgi:quinol monooxygenase YgiN
MRHGLYAKLIAKPGQRDAVVAILQRCLDELKSAGCLLYIINHAADHPDVIWITEVWESPQKQEASLQLPAVKAAIAEAMPMLTGEFEQVRLSVVGGLGLPD